MTQKFETFNVGTKAFISPAWPPMSKAAKNLPKIGKAFAVPLSFLFSASDEGKLSDAIPQAVFMLFEQLEEQDISELFSLILQDVYCKTTDKPVDLDQDFDSLDELLQLLASVLKQHYGCLIEGKGFRGLFQVMVPLSQAA